MACALPRSSAVVLTFRGERGRYSVAGAIGRVSSNVSRGPSAQPVALGQGASLLSRTAAGARALEASRQRRRSTRSFSHIGQAEDNTSALLRASELVVHLVALGPFPGLRLGVLGWMGLA